MESNIIVNDDTISKDYNTGGELYYGRRTTIPVNNDINNSSSSNNFTNGNNNSSNDTEIQNKTNLLISFRRKIGSSIRMNSSSSGGSANTKPDEGRERTPTNWYDNMKKPATAPAATSHGEGQENYFSLRRMRQGSDPRLQTCRGKLQNTRSKLNLEINKELMLRAGAENLLHASNNKKMKEQVAMELQFFNSNLQLLKEQLGELNSSVEIYQGNNARSSIPMIPLGLKETKEIDFRQPFKTFIETHYHEDASAYDEAITEFMELREAMRTPERDESGVALIFEYFNQLYFIDRRFFPPDRSLGIFFEWYDSLTGTPSCQRTVAFEKACVLFNLAALYTQLGARHDRTSAAGLDAAVNCLLRSAGVFKYLHNTFTNAPSKDLSPELLKALIELMLSQARECLHEKACLSCDDTTESLLELAQEAAHVAQEYNQVHQSMRVAVVRDYVPASWVTLVQIKSLYYVGKAHQHVSEALLWYTEDATTKEEMIKLGSMEEEESLGLSNRALEILQYLHKAPEEGEIDTMIDFSMPTNAKDRTYLGLSHGREANVQYDEALRQQRMCRELRRRTPLTDVLRNGHTIVNQLIEDFEEQNDLMAVFDPPSIMPSTKIQLSLAPPDFTQHRVDDVFHSLGPVSHFSAKKSWSVPRPIILKRTERQGFGFSVRGDAPVSVAAVDVDSLAERAGMQENDLVVSISGRDVKWLPHDRVVSAIRDSGDTLHMTLVTPLQTTQPYYQLTKCKSLKDLSSHSTTSSSSGVSSSSNSSTRSSKYGSINSSNLHTSINSSNLRSSINSSTLSSTHKDKRLSWNPFKKTLSRDRLKSESMNDCNLIAP
uniref:Rhophilin-2-like isoform X1 n=1 Tax=Hirondellea gigas TaxID=1518452 RepID=A0A6A7FWI3_9CRUS